MAKNLLIVESPAKAKTINKYLGKDFEVLASYGHVRDLVPKNGAVDPEHDFSMKYQVDERSKKHVDAIAKAAKKADTIYLATDLDREGEAISWHIRELLDEKKLLKDRPVHRVVFNEITPRAIKAAIDQPRDLSDHLVDAQQARRALDYLVGFNLSPLLWRKIRQGLSAGRVQSPALRMIVEREEQIEAFEPREYWTIETELSKQGNRFAGKLNVLEGEKLKQFSITSEEQAENARKSLSDKANGELMVGSVTRKQRKRRPAPPFITSTLQQEAARKLGFTAQRTMRVAQGLYEGVDIDGETAGLITYMRTDSVSLSADALDELRGTIEQKYGKEMLPEKPNFFQTKSKNAQEAHEAIRPVSASRLPSTLSGALDRDQLRLYELIWKRTVACQMREALIDTVSVDLHCGSAENVFRSTGSTVAFPGFLSVYEEGQDNDRPEDDPKQLPPLEQGDKISVEKLEGIQHFTEPPPRFTEASLVKALEEFGIGRPSTYASIISTLQSREYVEMDSKRFIPTDVGRVVAGFLSKHFTRYVDYDFTARLEDDLDAVSRGEKDWVPLMREFWSPFEELIEEKKNVTRDEVAARDLGTDPESGRPISVRIGRYGPFVQIGTKDDEEKPKFAGLRPGQKMDAITLDEALVLFNLPRDLGETPEGEELSVNIGRFGPYVRYGKKFASIKEDDPYTISRERALEIVKEKKEADANRVIQVFDDAGIEVLNGRYGPYVTNGKKNASVPKENDPKTLTLEQCQEILEKAPEKKRGRKAKPAAGKKKAPARKKTSKS
jgi:DNA topoisomerase-1